MTLHLALVIAAWLLVGWFLCVAGSEVEEPGPVNNRPVYLIPNDPDEGE